MKKISTMQAFSNEILKEQKLTVGMDLGDCWSFYCVLDEAGKIISGTESSNNTGSDEADLLATVLRAVLPAKLNELGHYS